MFTKKGMRWVGSIILIFLLSHNLYAIEHGGKEHAGKSTLIKEHAGKFIVEPSADDIRQTIKDYIYENSNQDVFTVYDSKIDKERELSFIRVHERVGKTGNYYYACADFKDVESGELVDLDLDVQQKGNDLTVVDVRIHKVDGKPRYTYDENDNRIPVEE